MQQILSLFQQHRRELFLTGATARNFLRTQQWGSPGVVELIALAPRAAVLQMEGLCPLYETQRGPIPIEINLEGGKCDGYITCVSPGKAPRMALQKALERRGFRIDALALSATGEVIDPFGAQEDLKENILRPIRGRDSNFFATDSLRLIGLSRLVSESNSKVSEGLLLAAQENAGRILYAPRTGWFRELTSLLCGAHPRQGLQSLFDTRVLGMVLPEVHQMVGFAETARFHHKDLWQHTLQVVAQSVPLPLVRWAALLHDLGKLWTRSYGAKGEVHFFQHEELGAILVEGIAARLQLAPSFQAQLSFLVRHHLRPSAYRSNWTDSAVRRLMRDAGALLEPLLQLSQADLTSARPKRRKEALQLAHELQQRIEQIQQQAQHTPPLPKGIGTQIMETFCLTPGPRIGRIKQLLEAQVEAGTLEPSQPPHYYITHLHHLAQLPD